MERLIPLYSALCKSCRVFIELVLDEETSALFFASDAKCFQLSVKLFSNPFFVSCNSTKIYRYIRFREEKSNIPGRELDRKHDRTSRCSPVH